MMSGMKEILLLLIVSLCLFSCQERRFQEAASRKFRLCELAFSKVKPIHDTILLKHKYYFENSVAKGNNDTNQSWIMFSKYCKDIIPFVLEQNEKDSLREFFDNRFAIGDADDNIIADYKGKCKEQQRAIKSIMDDTNHYFCLFLADWNDHPSLLELNLACLGLKKINLTS